MHVLALVTTLLLVLLMTFERGFLRVMMNLSRLERQVDASIADARLKVYLLQLVQLKIVVGVLTCHRWGWRWHLGLSVSSYFLLVLLVLVHKLHQHHLVPSDLCQLILGERFVALPIDLADLVSEIVNKLLLVHRQHFFGGRVLLLQRGLLCLLLVLLLAAALLDKGVFKHVDLLSQHLIVAGYLVSRIAVRSACRLKHLRRNLHLYALGLCLLRSSYRRGRIFMQAFMGHHAVEVVVKVVVIVVLITGSIDLLVMLDDATV